MTARGHGVHGGHDHGGDGADGGHGVHDHRGRRGLVRRALGAVAGHRHDPAGSVDRALSASDEGVRALKLSLAGLGATAALQAVVVAVSGSVALLADTVHNLADALTAVPLGIAFWLGRRPPTRRYTYGFGRAEDLAGIAVVVAIALSGAVAGWEALRGVADPHGVRHAGWVGAAGLVGFAGNELVARYRIAVGRRIGSAALVADGHHARSDGLTSLAVVAGALASAAGWDRADPAVGALIAVAILFVLKDAARAVYRRLMDSVEPALVDRVEEVVASVAGVQAVEAVRVRWIGHELWAEVEVVSDGDLRVTEAHAIAEEARHRLLHDVPRLTEAIIHTSPGGHDGTDHHAATAHHFDRGHR